MDYADFQRLLKVFLSRVEVDEAWYLASYPDVAEAVSNGDVANSQEHYQQSGYLEGRFPLKPVVDGQYYLRKNPDLVAAIEAGEVDDLEKHFIGAGYSEGRMATEFPVDEEFYNAEYIGADSPHGSAKSHFEAIGYFSGLLPFPT